MKKFFKFKLGIRSKVIAASIVILLVLLLSGVIAFFEFGRMSSYISHLISNNIQSVNTSRNLINLCDQYHTAVFQVAGTDYLKEIPEVKPLKEVEENLDRLSEVLTTDFERKMADSVRYAYSSYVQVVYEVEKMWVLSQEERLNWYFSDLQVVFDKLRGYLQQLAVGSQVALTDNYDNLNESYFRSIVPGLVAISAGIVLVLLFSYFLNIFFINPILKMYRGIKGYYDGHKSYNVTIEGGGDQLQEMNAMIKDIIDENKASLR